MRAPPVLAAARNWGVFLMNWLGGIGHNVWIALLCFVPGPLLKPIILGHKRACCAT